MKLLCEWLEAINVEKICDSAQVFETLKTICAIV